MKKTYKTPETTVVAIAPVKLLNDSPNPQVDPRTPTDDHPLMLNHTTIPSNTEY
jgi:hypothetical protein